MGKLHILEVDLSIDTCEGIKVRLIWSLAIHARIDHGDLWRVYFMKYLRKQNKNKRNRQGFSLSLN
jgi:hypothetical protein